MSNHTLSTTLLSGQGLGNQLWAYAATRSIAEELDMDFHLNGLEQFKGADFLKISTHIGLDCREIDRIEANAVPNSFNEQQFFDPELGLFATGFDERVLNLKSSYDLVGYFQSEKYFFGDLKKIKDYISISPEIVNLNSIPSDVCVINLRGGEYKRFKSLILPLDYWNNAKLNMQKLFGVDKFIVVTDDYQYAKTLFPSHEIISEKISKCYASLFNAKYVIASNSSFSYFPLKTNPNNPIVIAPQYWSRFNNPYGRWASPANLYSDWLWQDSGGNLLKYDECLSIAQKTIEHYSTHYNISTTAAVVNKGTLVSKLIPYRIRKLIKRGLSLVFPTRIG